MYGVGLNFSESPTIPISYTKVNGGNLRRHDIAVHNLSKQLTRWITLTTGLDSAKSCQFSHLAALHRSPAALQCDNQRHERLTVVTSTCPVNNERYGLRHNNSCMYSTLTTVEDDWLAMHEACVQGPSIAHVASRHNGASNFELPLVYRSPTNGRRPRTTFDHAAFPVPYLDLLLSIATAPCDMVGHS